VGRHFQNTFHVKVPGRRHNQLPHPHVYRSPGRGTNIFRNPGIMKHNGDIFHANLLTHPIPLLRPTQNLSRDQRSITAAGLPQALLRTLRDEDNHAA
jgi:hypothetical protein